MTELTGYPSVDGLQVALAAGVLRVTLIAPRAQPVINDVMIRGLIDTVTAASTDDQVRAVVLAGSGDHFCGGADIVARNRTDADAPKPRPGGIQRRLPTQAHHLVPLLLEVQVPVVCKVRGWASGLGCHLALASDFTIASRGARFVEPFVKRGFTPDSGATYLLHRLVGLARAKEMLLLGREISGEEAATWGMIHAAVEDDQLDSAVDALVAGLANGPTVALGLTKWLIHASRRRARPHRRERGFALELSSRTSDFREGMAAFRERRDPGFGGT